MKSNGLADIAGSLGQYSATVPMRNKQGRKKHIHSRVKPFQFRYGLCRAVTERLDLGGKLLPAIV